MIRFGLRLSLAGGREAATRLLIIAVAVALGVGMLLSTLAGINAVGAQNQRYGWLNTAVAPSSSDTSADPLWWLLREDYHHGRSIGRVEVAATGPDAPVPPGIPRLPGPGEYYVSPALGELLRDTPAAELGDRFPGHEIGTIGRAALPSPESLLIVIGRDPGDLEQLGATRITQIMTTSPSDCSGCYVGINHDGLTLVLSVVAAALLFPVLIFIGTATRLAATRREQRFAAMRLVGATPRQISLISAVESTLAASVGTAVGFGLFLALRPALAAIPFTGEAFFTADLSLTVVDVLAVALGVPLGAVVAAWLALRRVQISPLGVTRRVTPKPPRIWRLIPLAAGLAELTYFIDRRPPTTNAQITAYLSGFLLILVGLVLAGPWLTMIGARVLAGRASRPATLIAGRRLADNPQAGFRSVSGLIVALFVTSVATGTITTFVANRGEPRTDSVAATSLAKQFWPEEGPAPTVDQIPAGLSTIPGVRGVAVVRANPIDRPPVDPRGSTDSDDASYREWWPGVITCAELDRMAAFGSCPARAQVAVVAYDLIGMRAFDLTSDTYVWAAADIDPAEVDRQPIRSVVVNTTSRSAFEQARTMLINAFPQGRFPASVGEWESNSARQLNQFQQLANVIMLTSLPIAGCSLAVSVAGGLSDRKRPFSMLRLTGMQLRTLRRVVALETVVPLLVVAVVAIGMGFLAAHLFLRAQLGYTLLAPDGSFYLMVAGGLAVSLGIVALTLPLLRRVTGPETARNE
ncbi:FtsX-like permease family protein [Micromonospora eburnea]|uniref:FtsX-like permease family protein n=1 Tax=Micromonospora eburnea TaxID=227316 RepID=A0A1C6TUL0_9ACTN|nr:FtsX-like permease family protein [Micromonospora eburnea]SCL45474.1 FtsX-like permease family protein [Micromonospora eburnea]